MVAPGRLGTQTGLVEVVDAYLKQLVVQVVVVQVAFLEVHLVAQVAFLYQSRAMHGCMRQAVSECDPNSDLNNFEPLCYGIVH